MQAFVHKATQIYTFYEFKYLIGMFYALPMVWGRGSMKTFTFVIANANGLGSGPATKICREAEQYSSRIFVEQKGIELSARSLMGLLALQAACGDKIKVTIVGNDEDAAEKGMKKILQQELG